MQFRTTILQSGKTATGIRVPPEVVEALGSSKRPAVTVTINGYSYRSTVASMGGAFMLPVSAQVREQAGVNGGDEVDVQVEPDTAPREIVIPADFAAALDADQDAKQAFEKLSYSSKQWYVLPIESAKTAETRQRRVEKAIGLLRHGA